MGHSDVQTRLIDLFLAELEQIQTSDEPINFNNTNQLDALLSYLENSDVSQFTPVPSEIVIHILLTLACRSPQSSKTRGTVSSDDGIEVLSLYMREINDKYEHNLTKDLLQRRSANILDKYVDLIQSSESDHALKLYQNFQDVLRPICNASIHFSRPRSKPESKEETPVVEVIQDSESDVEDDDLSAGMEIETSLKYHQFGLPQKNVISLSDIGSKTTGLGEATSLFQNMPHLLAQATPEPEQLSPEGRPKKQKVERNPLEFVKLFDDHLIVSRLMNLKDYNLWDLLRWAFTCCGDSSQYQKFLFNSSNTSLHHIWETYSLTLRIILKFLKIQHDVSQKRQKRSFLGCLLTQLGRNQDWYERLVDVAFTGLGLLTQDRPFPCYPRERSLIKNDVNTNGSVGLRSKVDYDDNIESLHLRAHLVALFLYQETNRFHKVDLVTQLSNKLLMFDKDTIFAFLQRLNTQLFVPKQVLDKFILMVYNKLVITIVGSEDLAYNLIGYLDPTSTRIEKLTRLFKSSELYDGLVHDSTYKDFNDFKRCWDICIGLCYEMIKFIVTSEVLKEHQLDLKVYEDILSALHTFKDMSERHYIEFLESRSWNASGLDDEINFILEDEEIESSRLQFCKECKHDKYLSWISMFRPLSKSK